MILILLQSKEKFIFLNLDASDFSQLLMTIPLSPESCKYMLLLKVTNLTKQWLMKKVYFADCFICGYLKISSP